MPDWKTRLYSTLRYIHDPVSHDCSYRYCATLLLAFGVVSSLRGLHYAIMFHALLSHLANLWPQPYLSFYSVQYGGSGPSPPAISV